MNNIERYKDIYLRLRQLPEKTDMISAYGWDLDYDGEVLSDFYELMSEFLIDNKSNEELAVSFIQLYCWDFQNSHEGLFTFYENRYLSNPKEDVTLAIEWFKKNNHLELAEMMQKGYEENLRMEVSDWIYNNAENIYITYRDIMFRFEEKYSAFMM